MSEHNLTHHQDGIEITENQLTDEMSKREHHHSSGRGEHRHHHHSHEHSGRHSHHHGSSKEHSGHRRRRSKRRSENRKNRKAFFKNHRSAIINIVVIILAIVFVVSFEVGRNAQQAGRNTTSQIESKTTETTATVKIEAPFFKDEVYLIGVATREYLNTDLTMQAADVFSDYREEGVRLDIGVPVRLNYEVTGMPSGVSVSSVKVEVAENAVYTDAMVLTPKKDDAYVDVYYLKTGTQYYYRISLTLSNKSVTRVEGEFKTAVSPRILGIDGLVNVRDIGGWQTVDGKTIRQGLLYRGSELDGAMEAEYSITSNGIVTALTHLGIRTDMDLRSAEDAAKGKGGFGASVDRDFYNFIMYRGIFTEDGKASTKKVFSDLADKNRYPIYLHCTYGIDRTGTVCYLLGSLLGMDDDDLLRDYELSALYHGGSVKRDSINTLISAIDALPGTTRQEKVEGYLLSIGVTRAEIQSIKNIFLSE